MELLESLRSRCSELQPFVVWGEVLQFMHRGSSADLRKNAILLAIFEFRDRGHDSRLQSVLLAIMWPGLESIFRSRSTWDRDPDTLWTNVYWAFFQSLSKVDVSRRRDRLIQKLYNDTCHRLHEIYEKEWTRGRREVPLETWDDPEADEDEARTGSQPGEGDIGLAAVELGQSQEAQIRRLRVHLEKGRISEADFLLLVGTRIYGYPLSAVASRLEVPYEVAKKRRQRAEALLGRIEKRLCQ